LVVLAEQVGFARLERRSNSTRPIVMLRGSEPDEDDQLGTAIYIFMAAPGDAGNSIRDAAGLSAPIAARLGGPTKRSPAGMARV